MASEVQPDGSMKLRLEVPMSNRRWAMDLPETGGTEKVKAEGPGDKYAAGDWWQGGAGWVG